MEFNGNNNSNNNKSSQNNSGLLRYRSAPTPLLSNFTSLSPGFCSDDDQTISPVVHVMKTNDDDDDNGGCNKGFGCVKPPQYPRQNGLLSSFNYERLETNMGSGRYRVADGDANGDLLSTSSSRLKILSQIMEAEYENLDGHRTEHINGENLFSGFGSWNDDSSYYAENFVTSGVIKREMDDDRTVFVDTKNVETGNSIGATDKLLRFQDTVPCKFRAKRGCATHPRSIAERVRRTKISERMRKLQELVPNMDKQTNTADMLDLAVEYVKSLQKQYKTLSNIRANCKCSASEKMYLN